MNDPRAPWLMSGLLVMAAASGPAVAGPDDPPALVGPTELMLDDGRLAASPSPGPRHEAFGDATPAASGVAEAGLPQPPPEPIAERPTGARPAADAQWVGGYWGWDAAHGEFVWTPGAWRVAPAGKVWVDGQWRRDDRGWTRAPGAWADRRSDRVDWKKDGPPAERPAETVGPPPGPDSFFVVGQYVPEGDGLSYRPGYWAKSQPGWDWVPSRWVRRAEGWAYREGHWERALDDRGRPNEAVSPFRNRVLVSEPLDTGPSAVDPSSRRTVARPALDPSALPAANPGPPRSDPATRAELPSRVDDEAAKAGGPGAGSPAPRPDGADPAASGPVAHGPTPTDPFGRPAAMDPRAIGYPPYPPIGPGPDDPNGRPDPRADRRNPRRGPFPPARGLLREFFGGRRR